MITGSGKGVIGADQGNDTFTADGSSDLLIVGGGGDDTVSDGAGEGRFIGGPSGDTENQTIFRHVGGTTEVSFRMVDGSPLPHRLVLQDNAGGYALDSPPPLSPGQTLDIGRNTLMINYAGTSPLATLVAALKSGYDGGKWDGTGIVSSAAASNSGFGIGYQDTPTGPAGPPTGGTIELRYTLLGDANLDGRVDFADLLTLARHYGTGGTFTDGDANYDGQVGFSDLALLAQTYGHTLTQPITARASESIFKRMLKRHR